MQRVILAAQSDALAAQSDQFSMLERVRDLETEIARFKAWDSEKEKYELKDIWYGAFAYTRKEDAEPREPPHWLCTKCYNDGKKSILLHTDIISSPSNKLWMCPNCKAKIAVAYSILPSNLAEKREG